MSSMPEVEVLLATCNGERFLREQIDSILAQSYAHLRVLARDDGSSDGTVQILNEYAQRFPDRFRVLPKSPATGSAKGNFLLLMKASTADYICFSDQDDVWLAEKVSITRQAMDELESRWGNDIPLLVFTDLRVVDEQLKTLHESFWAHMGIEPGRIDRLAELLGKSVVTGCTAMVNRPLLELSLSMPEEASMHDRWIALLASVLGKSGIVRAQTVLYRQHGGNVVGLGISLGEQARPLREHWNRRAKAYLSEWKVNQQQASALLAVHDGKLSAKHRELLWAYTRCETSRSRFVRIATFVRNGFYREGWLRNLVMAVHLWKTKDRNAG